MIVSMQYRGNLVKKYIKVVAQEAVCWLLQFKLRVKLTQNLSINKNLHYCLQTSRLWPDSKIQVCKPRSHSFLAFRKLTSSHYTHIFIVKKKPISRSRDADIDQYWHWKRVGWNQCQRGWGGRRQRGWFDLLWLRQLVLVASLNQVPAHAKNRSIEIWTT